MNAPSPRPPVDRLLLAALFALVAGTYAYFFQGGGWNANSRFALTRAIVERGRLDVTPYRRTTGDLAYRDGRYYCDKAPGASWMAVPVYAAVHAASGAGRRPPRAVIELGLYASVLAVVALPSGLIAVLLARRTILMGVPAGRAVMVALAYALGTLAFPYSTLLYGHQIAAVLLFVAFDLLLGHAQVDTRPGRARVLGVGLLLGGSVAVEYPTALAAVIMGFWALWTVRPWSRFVWLAAGILPSAVALAAYHWVAFGGPFTVAYSFSTLPERHLGRFMGIAQIDPAVVSVLLLSGYRGLLISAPWLVAAIPGSLLFLASRRRSAPWIAVCVSIGGLLLALNAALVDWHGGYAFGPRYLVPALPFVALLCAGVFLPLRRAAAHAVRWTTDALMLGAIAMMLVGTAVRPEVPLDVPRPFEDLLVPSFVEGRLATNPIPVDRAMPPRRVDRSAAWNLGHGLGLDGLASLAPLAAWVGLWAVLMLWRLRGRHEAATLPLGTAQAPTL